MHYWPRRKVVFAVCTVGGHYQDQRPGLMPAGKRFVGEHVRQTRSVAGLRQFFLVSNTMGLVRADTGVAYFDDRLAAKDTDLLASKIEAQVRHYKIGVLEYYVGQEPWWRPYSTALQKGVIAGGGGLLYRTLPAATEHYQTLPAVDAPELASA